MAERRFPGRPASLGLVIGSLVPVGRTEAETSRRKGAPAEEAGALRGAMAKASADLEALSAVASGDGADILAFQIEMLADPALIEDVLVAIVGGQDVLEAWQAGLSAQIQDFETADDDYFRARASDLDDLKDRVGRALTGDPSPEAKNLPPGAVLLDRDLTPSRFLGLDQAKLGGIALTGGSSSSHVAMLARARGVPMVVGLEGPIDQVMAAEAVLDAEAGLLVLAPSAATREHYDSRLKRMQDAARLAASRRYEPALTVNGEHVEVWVNVDHPDAIDDDMLKAADGVGLLRTEFLFLGRPDLPGEDEQYGTYVDLLDRLTGRPAIIRTLDIGGDKPLAGIVPAVEANPFLGLRGIRLCLDRPELFRPQIRALLRAAVARPLRVMLPMVTVQAEVDEARAMFESCLADLNQAGVAAELPAIGIMVETPAAAIAIDRIDAAFYSIGSNDLIQYVMAAARDAGGRVSDLLDPETPAIERLIRQIVRHGQVSGKDVSLCGDMASDPALLPLLLRSGLRKISVAPAALDRVKTAIAGIDLSSERDEPA